MSSSRRSHRDPRHVAHLSSASPAVFGGIPGREAEPLTRDVDKLRRTAPLEAHPGLFHPIVENLLDHDPFLLLADYQSYIDAQDRVSALWRQPQAWTRQSILNSARLGNFKVQPGTSFV